MNASTVIHGVSRHRTVVVICKARFGRGLPWRRSSSLTYVQCRGTSSRQLRFRDLFESSCSVKAALMRPGCAPASRALRAGRGVSASFIGSFAVWRGGASRWSKDAASLDLNAAVRKWWRRRTGQPQMMYAAPCSCYPRCGDGSACDVRMPGDEGACRGAREQRRREAERQRQMAGADYERANHPGEAPPFRVRRGRRHGTHRSVGTHCNTLGSDARACSDRPLRARSVRMVRLRAPQRPDFRIQTSGIRMLSCGRRVDPDGVHFRNLDRAKTAAQASPQATPGDGSNATNYDISY